MRIYACGCSFTYGDELADPATQAWPAVLADMLQASITNEAVGGGTNARTVYHTIKNIGNDYDLYLIAWTSYARFTFYKSDDNQEINFTPQLDSASNLSKEFATISYKNWGSDLYKYWYNELYSFKLWLQQIIQLQSTLKSKPYLMINTLDNRLSKWLVDENLFIESVKYLINFDVMNDQQIFDECKEIQYYISLVDTNKFYQWPNFYIAQLCKTFKCGPRGHILEEGHQHLADLIYTHVQDKTSHS